MSASSWCRTGSIPPHLWSTAPLFWAKYPKIQKVADVQGRSEYVLPVLNYANHLTSPCLLTSNSFHTVARFHSNFNFNRLKHISKYKETHPMRGLWSLERLKLNEICRFLLVLNVHMKSHKTDTIHHVHLNEYNATQYGTTKNEISDDRTAII